jgi:hypothetical protein
MSIRSARWPPGACFRLGDRAGYRLRRMPVDQNGTPRSELASGEQGRDGWRSREFRITHSHRASLQPIAPAINRRHPDSVKLWAAKENLHPS